jgi:hypothetical protein
MPIAPVSDAPPLAACRGLPAERNATEGKEADHHREDSGNREFLLGRLHEKTSDPL